jgi:hypothetical protein
VQRRVAGFDGAAVCVWLLLGAGAVGVVADGVEPTVLVVLVVLDLCATTQ